MLSLLALALASSGACPSPKVHDGDSIRCGGERIRIANIDAPELPGSPKCRGYRFRYVWCDYGKGRRARDSLGAFLSTGDVQVRRVGTDRYGRTLGLVSVRGIDAGRFLIGKGLARVWR